MSGFGLCPPRVLGLGRSLPGIYRVLRIPTTVVIFVSQRSIFFRQFSWYGVDLVSVRLTSKVTFAWPKEN